MIHRSKPFPFACAALLLAFALAACQGVGKRPGSTVQTGGATARLESADPIDVAVLPVKNASGAQTLPARLLREAFIDGLVERRYSPLAQEFVDRRVTDAGWSPGAAAEDAALVLSVERWDDSLWSTHSAVEVTLTARLLAGAGSESGELWSGKVARRFELGREQGRATTAGAAQALLCREIAREVLSALPARAPSAAPRG